MRIFPPLFLLCNKTHSRNGRSFPYRESMFREYKVLAQNIGESIAYVQSLHCKEPPNQLLPRPISVQTNHSLDWIDTRQAMYDDEI
mmetsp:Transcript_19122/g.47276  ORF Transcript_19122/g.47276 Transcript_19122/m.47276 type:complete len:86 (-) Transcript_19122:614-871(-)